MRQEQKPAVACRKDYGRYRQIRQYKPGSYCLPLVDFSRDRRIDERGAIFLEIEHFLFWVVIISICAYS